MNERTKLLKMVEEAIEKSSDNSQVIAENVIDATADWFEIVLEQIGIQPSSIPTLLRWQAHQHEYLNDELKDIELPVGLYES